MAVEVENLREFVQEFGEPDARSLLGHAVRHFFENGGARAWIVRVAAATGVVLTPDTEPFERQLLPASGAGGAYLLDRVNLINLLCVPGETTPAVVAALQAFCLARRIFLIADAPQGEMPFTPDAKITGEAARNSAMYLPWMLPADSSTSKIHAFPPCGFVAGIYAREDRTRGVWKAPGRPRGDAGRRDRTRGGRDRARRRRAHRARRQRDSIARRSHRRVGQPHARRRRRQRV